MVKDDSQRKILKWIELNAKEDTVHKMWLDPDKPLWRWKQMALDASAIQKKKGLKINSLSFPERKLQKKLQYSTNIWRTNELTMHYNQMEFTLGIQAWFSI